MFTVPRPSWFVSVGLLLVACLGLARSDDHYAALASAITSPLYPSLEEASAGYTDNAIVLRMELARRMLKEFSSTDDGVRQIQDAALKQLDHCSAARERIRELDNRTPDYLGILDKTAKAGPSMFRRDPVTNKLLPADQAAVNNVIAKAAEELIKAGITQYQLSEEWKEYHRHYLAVRSTGLQLLPIARRRPCLYGIGTYVSRSKPGERARLSVSSVLGQSPAEEAGIVAGDVIVAVNGKPVVIGDSINEAAAGIIAPGEFGSELVLRIERDGESKDHVLKRTYAFDDVENLLSLKLMGSCDGAYGTDELYVRNNAGRELTNCLLLVWLIDGDNACRHLHFVQSWPAGEELIGMYHNGLSSSIARGGSHRFVERVEVEVFSDQFQGIVNYRYWDSRDRAEQMKDYAENKVDFTGNFIPEVDGLLYKGDGLYRSDAAVRVWLEQVKGKVAPELVPREISVTVSEGDNSATATWESIVWQGGNPLTNFKTFSSPKFNQIKTPDYYEVTLRFHGTDYERVITFGDKPMPVRDPRVRTIILE